MQSRFTDEGFEFERLNLLGSTYRQLADIGELLITFDQITDGDRDSWVAAFTKLAERLRQHADDCRANNHAISARNAYLRTATYYYTASANSPGTKNPDGFTECWTRSRECWDLAIEGFDPAVEKVAIPYEGTTLEGYLFHSGRDEPRPTLILNNGSDGSVQDMWMFGAAAAVERGWNALTFDGPGQGAALHRDHTAFRPDWEAVITPVVDWALTRAEVDPAQLVLQGISQAGYWVPRALAFEHRIAAGIADPGVMRVDTSWTAQLPDFMQKSLASGNKKEFDELMTIGMADEPVLRAILAWRMAPYGTTSYFDAYTAAAAQTLDAKILAGITCPLLITSPEHEQFWPGQSEAMHAAVTNSTLITFTEAEGADWHCEPAAHGLRDERVFNWIEDTLAARHSGA
jgi:hypothetical protein